MKNLTKIIIGIAAAITIIAVVVIGSALNSGTNTPTPSKVPVTVETETPTPAQTPTEEPADGGTMGLDEYYDTYTEYTEFAAGESLTVIVGGVTKDCATETLMTDTAYIDGYRVAYTDTAHTTVDSISCSQSGAGDLFGE